MIGGNHDRWGDTFWGRETGVTFDPPRAALPRSAPATCWPFTATACTRNGRGRRCSTASSTRRPRSPASTCSPPPSASGSPSGSATTRRTPRHILNSSSCAATRQARWAERRLRADPGHRSALIMGHTHREALREVEPGRWYLNPGAWLGERRYATGRRISDSARIVQLTVRSHAGSTISTGASAPPMNTAPTRANRSASSVATQRWDGRGDRRRGEAGIGQHTCQLARRLFARCRSADTDGPMTRPSSGFEHRIVGAAEHQRVDTGRERTGARYSSATS